MIIIRTNQNQKYWTKAYKEVGDFLEFESETREGIIRKVKLNKNAVVEISEIDKDFKD